MRFGFFGFIPLIACIIRSKIVLDESSNEDVTYYRVISNEVEMVNSTDGVEYENLVPIKIENLTAIAVAHTWSRDSFAFCNYNEDTGFDYVPTNGFFPRLINFVTIIWNKSLRKSVGYEYTSLDYNNEQFTVNWETVHKDIDKEADIVPADDETNSYVDMLDSVTDFLDKHSDICCTWCAREFTDAERNETRYKVSVSIGQMDLRLANRSICTRGGQPYDGRPAAKAARQRSLEETLAALKSSMEEVAANQNGVTNSTNNGHTTNGTIDYADSFGKYVFH